MKAFHLPLDKLNRKTKKCLKTILFDQNPNYTIKQYLTALRPELERRKFGYPLSWKIPILDIEDVEWLNIGIDAAIPGADHNAIILAHFEAKEVIIIDGIEYGESPLKSYLEAFQHIIKLELVRSLRK